MKKKSFIFFCICLLCAATITAHAQSGTTGNLSWNFSGDTLTISGNGAMPDAGCPWFFKRSPKVVVIKNGITSIGAWVFDSHVDITSVVIPNSVTSIGDRAFWGCHNLRSVAIPKSVTSIGNYAFFMSGLTSIDVDERNTAYASIDGVLFNKTITKLIQYPAKKPEIHYAIPNSVTSIGIGAFCYCNGLRSIDIPNSLTSIEAAAFVHCWRLTSITIPNSVTSIGNYAFDKCSRLTEIINHATTPQSIDDDVFPELCESLILRVPATSVSAYQSAKGWNCIENIVAIDENDDDYMTGTNGTITWTLCKNDFYAGYTLTISGNGAMPDYDSYNMPWAFYRRSISAIEIEHGITRIGNNAFKSCSGLMFVTIPNSVNSIGNDAFAYCRDLTSVSIPNSVTCIGNGIFANCRSLTSVTIPNSVTSIGDYAFRFCNNLTSVIILGMVTSIGESAFMGCMKLTSVNIPISVTSIGDYAFFYCSLTSVSISYSVTFIGDHAFKNCTRLTEVINHATIPQTIDVNVFDGIDKSAVTLRVPATSVAAYQTATGWSDFGNIVAIDLVKYDNE